MGFFIDEISANPFAISDLHSLCNLSPSSGNGGSTPSPSASSEAWVFCQAKWTCTESVEQAKTWKVKERSWNGVTATATVGIAPTGWFKNTRWFISHYDFRMGCDPHPSIQLGDTIWTNWNLLLDAY